MDLSVLISLLLKLSLLLIFVEFGSDNIIIVGLPEFIGGFRSQNFLIGHNFLVVKFQVLVGHDVVVFEVLVHVWWEFHL